MTRLSEERKAGERHGYKNGSARERRRQRIFKGNVLLTVLSHRLIKGKHWKGFPENGKRNIL